MLDNFLNGGGVPADGAHSPNPSGVDIYDVPIEHFSKPTDEDYLEAYAKMVAERNDNGQQMTPDVAENIQNMSMDAENPRPDINPHDIEDIGQVGGKYGGGPGFGQSNYGEEPPRYPFAGAGRLTPNKYR